MPLTGGSDARREALPANLKQAEAPSPDPLDASVKLAGTQSARSEGRARANDPRADMLLELTRAAAGAGQLAAGAAHARHEVSSILEDPVGRRALDRLLITPETVREHPELRRSFAAYITPDGLRSRIDLTQADRIYSAAAMDQVETLRRRTNEFLGDVEGLRVTARLAGENAESADIRGLIHADQVQSWYVVPIGVFLVLILTLRDPAGLPQSGRHDGPDLCLRPGGDALAVRHDPGAPRGSTGRCPISCSSSLWRWAWITTYS